jgi:hypothetical protein
LSPVAGEGAGCDPVVVGGAVGFVVGGAVGFVVGGAVGFVVGGDVALVVGGDPPLVVGGEVPPVVLGGVPPAVVVGPGGAPLVAGLEPVLPDVPPGPGIPLTSRATPPSSVVTTVEMFPTRPSCCEPPFELEPIFVAGEGLT